MNNKLLNTLTEVIMPAAYLISGLALLTGAIPRWMASPARSRVFGVVLVGYGFFRVYRRLRKKNPS